MRLLFLAFLILAFAQPFFADSAKLNSSNRLQAIYIDNSASMSLKKRSQRLVDIAAQAARKQVEQASPGTKFILLTNNKPVSYRPMSADKTLSELSKVDVSAQPKSMSQVLSVLQTISRSETADGVDLYYYSDFAENTVAEAPKESLAENLSLYAIPVKAANTSNVYIDSAYLTSPVLQSEGSNELIVRTKLSGEMPDEEPVMNLIVNGQVKSATTLRFGDDKQQTDTLSFRVNSAAWQNILLIVNDAALRTDDTFRITARSAPNLSVLCINEGSSSPYIQAAFRAYNGFRLNNASINNVPDNWDDYSLVILNGITNISSKLTAGVKTALDKGQTVCIFPGKTNNTEALANGLAEVADIQITGIDTATQSATTLQSGSDLVKEVFEEVPENVQLPAAAWHYELRAGLSANQQSVLSFRDGDPLFAKYTPSQGDLYILSTGIDQQSGDFPASYFFAPFIYRMATQSAGGNVYALMMGDGQPAFIPMKNASERNMLRLIDGNIDAIPPQRMQGLGLNVFVDDVVAQPGFYPLVAENTDTTIIAVNAGRAESELRYADIKTLKNNWKEVDIQVLDIDNIKASKEGSAFGSFPLWKVCVIFALIMLAVETWVLTGGFRKPTAATQ